MPTIKSNTFLNVFSSLLYHPKINNILKKQKLFDVTLRDGLQSLPKDKTINYNLESKKELYNLIKKYKNPTYLEVGSLVSPKVLPVMNESKEFYKWCVETSKQNNHFLLIPNSNKLTYENMALCRNYSFITSVSQEFQKKNINKTLEQTKDDILIMVDKISSSYIPRNNYFIKLYVSCINECPIQGKFCNNYVIDELVWNYNAYKPNLLCISDTCGTLTSRDFKYIVDEVIEKGVSPDNISLHLHVNDDKEEETIDIIHSAFDREIYNFDVTSFDRGGCSVTMGQSKLKNNLTYDLYYKSLFLYKLENIIN